MKKVLILAASPRKNGNSDALCAAFAKGALEAGNEVETIRVADKKIGFCRACEACQKTGVCVQKDDMAEILDKMLASDVMVLATPSYFYSMDAQLKVVIDRSFPRWTEVKDKEMYYIITGADPRTETAETILAGLRGYASDIVGSKEMGVIYGLGTHDKGDIDGKPALDEAYEMGKAV